MSPKLSGLSVLRFSSLFIELSVIDDGDATPLGDVGEIPFGVCVVDPEFDASDSSAMELFRDFVPAPMRLFFCLNFSSQVLLFAFIWLSEFPTDVAKKRAFSLIMASVKGRPDLWWLRAQFDSARSMSGNFPFDLLIGERLPSS